MVVMLTAFAVESMPPAGSWTRRDAADLPFLRQHSVDRAAMTLAASGIIPQPTVGGATTETLGFRLSATNHSSKNQTTLNPECFQNTVQLSFSGFSDMIPGIVPALGHKGYCEGPAIAKARGSQFCTGRMTFVCVIDDETVYESNAVYNCPVEPAGVALGLCVPNEVNCSTKDLNDYLFWLSTADPLTMPIPYDILGLGIQSNWGPHGYCLNPEYTSQCDKNKSFSYMSATCPRDRQPWYTDHGALIVAIGIFIICGVIAICTFIMRMESVGVQYCMDGGSNDDDDDAVYTSPAKSLQKERYDGHYRADEYPEIDAEQKAMLNVYDGSSKVYRGKQQPKTWLPRRLLTFAKWFDIFESIGDLFTVRSRNVADVDTRFFEGVRTLAMLFVVYGHTLYFPATNVGDSNIHGILTFLGSYPGIGVYPAVLAVDVFFFLSGFLFMHLYMKRVVKEHEQKLKDLSPSEEPPRMMPLGPLMTLKMYLHRWLRMTPCVMAVLAVATYLMKFVPSGPLESSYMNSPYFEVCKKYWWHQLLYMTNLGGIHHEDWNLCVGWFWYMSCDMQMFIVGPILAAAFVLFEPVFYVLVLAGIAGSAAGGAYNHVFTNQLEYVKTWYRAAPYVYGFFAAVLVRKQFVRDIVRKPVLRFVIYVLGTGFMVSSINLIWLIHKKDNDTRLVTFGHGWVFSCWGLGLLLFTVPWACGHGGVVPNKILSHNAFAIMSKLTFTAYLIHPVVISIIVASQAHVPDWSQLTYYYHFGGYTVWAFVAATALWIVIEFPFAQMNNALTK